jgi:hypothetical protein
MQINVEIQSELLNDNREVGLASERRTLPQYTWLGLEPSWKIFNRRKKLKRLTLNDDCPHFFHDSHDDCALRTSLDDRNLANARVLPAARGAAHLSHVSPFEPAKPCDQHAYPTNKPKRGEAQSDVTLVMNVARTHTDSRKTEHRFPRHTPAGRRKATEACRCRFSIVPFTSGIVTHSSVVASGTA